MSDQALLKSIARHRIAAERAAFIAGVKWVATQLYAAASLLDRGEKAPYAQHCRELAVTLETEAQNVADQTFPEWKE